MKLENISKKGCFLSITQKVKKPAILPWLGPKLSSFQVDFHFLQAFCNWLF